MVDIAARKELLLSSNPLVATAQQYLAKQDYYSFLVFAEEAMESLSGEDLGEMYLMRAQIKIFYADATMLDDLKMAKKLLPDGSGIPTMGSRFRCDTPSIFTVFNPQGGTISEYKLALRKSMQLLGKLVGGTGLDLALLCESEMLYLTGYIGRARELAEPIYEKASAEGAGYIAMMAGYTLVRCHIALGDPARVEAVLTQLIRYSKILSKPQYRVLYSGIRGWVNCTTGWLGETPRYHIAPNGVEMPVLEDRIQVMSEGIAVRGQFEAALLKAARREVPECYAIKDLYVNLYDAMILFKLGKKDEAADIFYEMYVVSQKNRIIMPFAEYGRQILPLLHYALSRRDSARFARRWSDKLNQVATQYEESLRLVRGEIQGVEHVISEPLSADEMTVLERMAREMTIAEIAESMDISQAATKDHIRAIYRKIGAHNRSEAVAKALGGHIVSLEKETVSSSA